MVDFLYWGGEGVDDKADPANSVIDLAPKRGPLPKDRDLAILLDQISTSARPRPI